MSALIAPARRVRALGALAVFACLTLGLGLQLVDRSPVIDVLGSMLYVVLVGLLVLLIWPALPRLAVASIGLAIATMVELLQLTGIPSAVVAVLPPARLVFGSAFDPLDLVAYVGGALLLLPLLHAITQQARRSSRPR